MQTILVTDDLEEWSFLKSILPVVATSSYLSHQSSYKNQSICVINLSCCYQYQSIGYYVSLLAEAREHEIFPSCINIQDILNLNLSKLMFNIIEKDIQETFSHVKEDNVTVNIYFGKNKTKKYNELAHKLHTLFPLPLLRVEFTKQKKWKIKTLIPLLVQNIPEHHIKFMQESAADYLRNKPLITFPLDTQLTISKPIKKKQSHQLHNKKFLYNLAILVELNEGEMAPSNKKALEQFKAAGELLDLNVDIITKKDIKIVSKYDALFIRTTTSVNHYTYQLARYAAKNNLIVIDDPQSIIKCTNKIFLAELFDKHLILTPHTQFINKYDTTLPLVEFPCVLKKPDGSCSQGVVKIDDLKSLKQALKTFFNTSDMLLIQPFIYTEFDWRIGILDNKPLYACRYYMAKHHWQIVNWRNDDALIHDAVLIDDVPSAILQLALRATKFIGDGLYGVDIKSKDNQHYIIEVNDNPSINFGIEDQFLKNTLYEKIINTFLQRLHRKHGLCH